MRSDYKVYLSKFTYISEVFSKKNIYFRSRPFKVYVIITLGLNSAAASLFFFFLVNKETLFHMKDNTRQDVGLFSFLLCKLKITMGWEDLNMKILKSTLDFWVAFLFVLPTCHG